MNLRIQGFILLILAFMLAGCGKLVKQPESERVIAGPWIRPIAGGMEGIEGFFLFPDGHLRLINIFSMQGDSWSVVGDKLTLYTHTERYPQPMVDTLRILSLSDDKLTLVHKDFSTVYHRPAFNKDLLETRWIVAYLPGALAKPGKAASFSLKSGGVIKGFTGCNTFGGSYSASKNTIMLRPHLAAETVCPAKLVENLFLKSLEEAEEFLVVENQLYLYKGNVLQVMFKAQGEHNDLGK